MINNAILLFSLWSFLDVKQHFDSHRACHSQQSTFPSIILETSCQPRLSTPPHCQHLDSGLCIFLPRQIYICSLHFPFRPAITLFSTQEPERLFLNKTAHISSHCHLDQVSPFTGQELLHNLILASSNPFLFISAGPSSSPLLAWPQCQE